MSNEFFSDSLDGLFDAPKTEDGAPKVNRAPESYQPNKAFIEGCPSCRGSGNWRPGYPCFKCKGKGKLTFKTSPEARAKERERAAQKAVQKSIDLLNCVEAFKAAHAEVWAWIRANDDFEFARSMNEALHKYGELTASQLAACERCVAKNKQRAEERAKAAEQRIANAPQVDTAGIDRLKVAFDKAIAYSAEKGLRLSPRITIDGMTISPAKATSANPGALYVKSREAYLGKIAGGKFFASRECQPEDTAKIQKFIADPAEAAKVYGQTTGTCCICNATLRSEWKHRGIGPICAEKFGW